MAPSSSLTAQVRSPHTSSDEDSSAEPSAKRRKLNLMKCKRCRTSRKKCLDVTKANPNFPVPDVLVNGAPVLVDGKPLQSCKRCYTLKQKYPNDPAYDCSVREENTRKRGKSKKNREASPAQAPALSAAHALDANLLAAVSGQGALGGVDALLAAAQAATPGSLLAATEKLQTLSVERKKAQSEIDASKQEIAILNGKVMVLSAKIGLLPDQIPTLSAMIGGFSTEIASLTERLKQQKSTLEGIETEEQNTLTVIQAGVQNLSRAA